MTSKTRLKKIEQARTAGKPEKVVVMYDAHGDELATFDGVKMTQAEAEAKAAAQPDSVIVIRVTYASGAIKDGEE